MLSGYHVLFDVPWYSDAMTIKLDLQPEIVGRLQGLAEASGSSVERYAARLIEEAIPSERHDALVLLDSWQEEDATEDSEELARRREEWAELKTRLNEGHSSDRILFP